MQSAGSPRLKSASPLLHTHALSMLEALLSREGTEGAPARTAAATALAATPAAGSPVSGSPIATTVFAAIPTTGSLIAGTRAVAATAEVTHRPGAETVPGPVSGSDEDFLEWAAEGEPAVMPPTALPASPSLDLTHEHGSLSFKDPTAVPELPDEPIAFGPTSDSDEDFAGEGRGGHTA